jgi:enoyl-CoA hydratase
MITSDPGAQSDEVVVDMHDAIMTIRLNRPHQRNAVNAAMSRTIADALDRLDATPDLRVAIISGTDGNFCSGMDLKAFLKGERPEAAGRGFAGLTERPSIKPLIAAVEGYALAGGFEIVLACDLVVAADDAMFGLPEVKRGLLAGSGGLVRLPLRMPPTIAMEYALTGDLMPAAVAERWGLVNRLTPAGGAEAAARELAQQITRNGPRAVVAAKQVVVESADWPAQSRWARQREILESILDSEEAREGASAFAERRDPEWVLSE